MVPRVSGLSSNAAMKLMQPTIVPISIGTASPVPQEAASQVIPGVKFTRAWKTKIDQWIGANQAKIDKILTSYEVPLLAISESSAAQANAK